MCLDTALAYASATRVLKGLRLADETIGAFHTNSGHIKAPSIISPFTVFRAAAASTAAAFRWSGRTEASRRAHRPLRRALPPFIEGAGGQYESIPCLK